MAPVLEYGFVGGIWCELPPDELNQPPLPSMKATDCCLGGQQVEHFRGGCLLLKEFCQLLRSSLLPPLSNPAENGKREKDRDPDGAPERRAEKGEPAEVDVGAAEERDEQTVAA